MRQLTSLVHLIKAIFNGEPSVVLGAALRGQTHPMTPDQKRATLLHYAQRYGTPQFLETGTYLGDTLAYLAPHFTHLASIELSKELFQKARQRFDGHGKISLYQGDSAEIIPGLMDALEERGLIWLDAHYSGGFTAIAGDEETPILAELRQVFARNAHKHIILIDDAREFGGNAAYPPLDVVARVADKAGYSCESRFDIIRLLPR